MNDSIASITREQVTDVILNRFGFSSKNEQVDVIMTLTHDQKDLIFLVKTRFEKSIIFQTMSLMFSVRTTIQGRRIVVSYLRD